ncbi:MAG: hypothetical protein ACI9RV_002340, partial [Glaciecola sp.]
QKFKIAVIHGDFFCQNFIHFLYRVTDPIIKKLKTKN